MPKFPKLADSAPPTSQSRCATFATAAAATTAARCGRSRARSTTTIWRSRRPISPAFRRRRPTLRSRPIPRTGGAAQRSTATAIAPRALSDALLSRRGRQPADRYAAPEGPACGLSRKAVARLALVRAAELDTTLTCGDRRKAVRPRHCRSRCVSCLAAPRSIERRASAINCFSGRHREPTQHARCWKRPEPSS